MKKLVSIGLFILISCACSSKKASDQQSGESCMDIIKNIKIKAPQNITYYGIYSNVDNVKAPDINRYVIRIVNDGRDCQAIVMDFMDSDRPKFWTFSDKFDCKQKQVLLKNNLAFHRPYKKQLPFERPITIKVLKPLMQDMQAIVYFIAENEWKKPEMKKLTLKRQTDMDQKMAPFDWETIKTMKMKASCFRKE